MADERGQAEGLLAELSSKAMRRSGLSSAVSNGNL
ncbi:MAG: hypothetical protein JWN52_7783 [Actinomycetia bacterium]|jgi:hypothetical protein|nr:hypothetical protein [Actinomycetes bacterium]